MLHKTVVKKKFNAPEIPILKIKDHCVFSAFYRLVNPFWTIDHLVSRLPVCFLMQNSEFKLRNVIMKLSNVNYMKPCLFVENFQTIAFITFNESSKAHVSFD